MAAKYIAGLIKDGSAIRAIAVLFPEYISHSTMAARMFKNRHGIVSAGFYTIGESPEDVKVHGESIGLNLAVRTADTFLIKEVLGLVHRDRGDEIPEGARPGDIVRLLSERYNDFDVDKVT